MKYLWLLIVLSLALYPQSLCAQESIKSSCESSLNIADQYCVPAINMTLDFEVGQKFFESINGLSCEQLNSLKAEVYEHYMNRPETNLYYLLRSRSTTAYSQIKKREEELEKAEKALTKTEWKFIVNMFFIYGSGVKLGISLGKSGPTAMAMIDTIKLLNKVYQLFELYKSREKQLYGLRNMRRALYTDMDYIESEREVLMNVHVYNNQEAIKTFNGLCDIVMTYCQTSPCPTNSDVQSQQVIKPSS